MNLGELTKKAARAGVPLAILEKDYAISVVLRIISESELKDSLIFKGGTAIKKAYFSEARFSEDIDFTVINRKPTDVGNVVREIFEGRKTGDFEVLAVEREKTSAGLRIALKFLGPLRHPQRIRVDFSFREKPAAPVKEEKIVDEHQPPGYSLKTMGLEEILAEKLRAVSSRSAPRDLHDIWFLTQKGVKVDSQLVAKKFELYNEKFEKQKALGRISELKRNWKGDLRQFMKRVPSFETVEKEVRELLAKEF